MFSCAHFLWLLPAVDGVLSNIETYQERVFHQNWIGYWWKVCIWEARVI